MLFDSVVQVPRHGVVTFRTRQQVMDPEEAWDDWNYFFTVCEDIGAISRHTADTTWEMHKCLVIPLILDHLKGRNENGASNYCLW